MIFNHEIREKAVILCWITLLLIIISVIFIFSNTLLTTHLLKSINNVFINNDDSRRASEFLHKKTDKTGLLGYWYSMRNSTNQLFVFTLFQNGILVPLGAEVSSDGNVKEIIPLSAHAVQIYDNIPNSILNIYISKIEKTTHVNMDVIK